MEEKKGAIGRFLSLFVSIQFIKFLAAGGTAALLNFFSGLVFRVLYPGLPNEVSILVGYTAGTIVSFILNKLFTFKARDEKTYVQALKFTLLAVTSIILAEVISRFVLWIYFYTLVSAFISGSVIIVDWLRGAKSIPVDYAMAQNISHVVAIGITTIYNFLAMKFFSFKKLSGNKMTISDEPGAGKE
jgi:putative flippase GtrA